MSPVRLISTRTKYPHEGKVRPLYHGVAECATTIDMSLLSWYNVPADEGAVAGWLRLSRGTSRLPVPEGAQSPHETASGGRPAKAAPDHNRNRKDSRRRQGAGKGRTGGARAHQRPRRRGRLGECATGSKVSGPGHAARAAGSVSPQRRRQGRATPGKPGAAAPHGGETDDGRPSGRQNREYDLIGLDADVAELADATDLGSVTLRGVEVQILSSAPLSFDCGPVA